MARSREVLIPYGPRPAFAAFHDREERWACIVAHRRAGKTVAAVNDLIHAAMACQEPEPRFAYVAPFTSQAKDVAWSYLRQYTAPIAGARASVSELRVDLPNGGRIRLYGADNYNRLGDQVGQLSQLNWPALQQQNPAQAQALMHQFFQLRQAHEIAAGRLRHQEAVAAFGRQREHARRVEQGHAALHREIDGWSPELAGRLARYAAGQGITAEELDELSDPRLVKILHHACLGHEAQQQASAGKRLARAQAVRPAIEVGGSGGAPSDPNRMSTADWMKHRRGQLRSKGHNR
ncbi:MAG TPA: hypothetical protein VGM25_06445 [Caulobacteraceae bacterium]|jgi:hypothetical protein